MSDARSHRPYVALFIGTELAYDRDLLRGIGDYLQRPDRWRLHLMERRDLHERAHLGKWYGDGIIASVHTKQDAQLLRRMRLPAVAIGVVPAVAGIGQVQTAVDEGSRLVAEHLLERGLRNFAYVGWAATGDTRPPGVYGSQRRGEAFLAALRQTIGDDVDLPVAELERFPDNREKQMARLSAFLTALPKPAGVFAVMDNCAVWVMQAAQDAGLKVPDELAVIGAHNDELLCEFLHPPLSSLEQDAQRMGFEAARLLDGMMAGHKPPALPVLVPPVAVVARGSTDVQHTEDPHVAAALVLIRRRAREGIDVGDVVRQSTIGRSNLERRFRRVTGRTIGEQIRLQRLEAVKELLRETDLPLVDVAIRCGFQYASGLSAAFARAMGTAPGAYRNEHRRR